MQHGKDMPGKTTKGNDDSIESSENEREKRTKESPAPPATADSSAFEGSSSAAGEGVAPVEGTNTETQPGHSKETSQNAIGKGSEKEEEEEGEEEEHKGGKDEGKMWMYLDGVNPTQHGPFPQSIMLKLLRTGSAHKDMMAWAEGMANWQALGQVNGVCAYACVFFCFCNRHLGSLQVIMLCCRWSIIPRDMEQRLSALFARQQH